MPKLLKYEGFTNGYEYLGSSENGFKVEELTSDNSHSCQLDTIYLHYTLLTEEESVLCSLNLNPKKVMKKTKVFHA